MTVDPAPDGWFIEHNNLFYHVNEPWLAEMFRHQVKPYGNNPAYNRLLHAFRQGASADVIGERFRDFIDHRQKPARGNTTTAPSEFQQFIKTQRGRRANRG